MTPLVSCICPTYNRFPDKIHLLEEAIESFLRQDYPAKELIVVNDTPGQEFVCPDVRIVNLKQRLKSLGDKYNVGAMLARGTLIAPWEDDDISLPGRLSQAVACLGNNDYWKPSQVVYLPGAVPIFEHAQGVRHHASLFTKAAWRRLGGYPAVSGAQDAIMDRRLGQAIVTELAWQDYQYIYRWGVSDCHLSGSSDAESFYQAWGAKPVVQGRFTLHPHWQQDYEELCARTLRASSCPTLTT